MFETVLANLISFLVISTDKNIHYQKIAKADMEIALRKTSFSKRKSEITAIIIGAREFCRKNIDDCIENDYSLSKETVDILMGPLYPFLLSGDVFISGAQNRINFTYNGKNINATIF